MKIATIASNFKTVWGTATYSSHDGVVITPSVIATKPSETSAPLVMCSHPETLNARNFELSIIMTTDKQLRTGSAPNAWETFWLGFNWTTDSNGKKKCNFFQVKTNGCQLSTAFDEVGETFIATPSAPVMTVGVYNLVKIKKVEKHVQVWVDDVLVIDVTDPRIYDVAGGIGLYSEDSVARFQYLDFKKLA